MTKLADNRSSFVHLGESELIECDGEMFRRWIAPLDLRLINISSVRNRPLRPSRIKWLDENYNPKLVVVHVALRKDGTMTIIGGGHCGQVSVNKNRPIQTCFIWEVKDLNEERQLYRGLNNVQRETGNETFANDYQSGNAEAVTLMDVIESAGRTWAAEGSTWDICRSIGGLRLLLRKVGPETLRNGLQLGTDAWKEQMGASTNDAIFALTFLYERYESTPGKFPWNEVVAFLKTQRPRGLRVRAQQSEWWRTGDTLHHGRQTARYLAELYNAAGHKPKLVFADGRVSK